ncbi:MAG TPA: gamma-glutamyltransferase [Candidatus Krumholzibacteria bacterium]|nr:gamma-glutamyltransferase [Candidatus Krumholzibacteria bacterium]
MRRVPVIFLLALAVAAPAHATAPPVRTSGGMVVSANAVAAQVGASVMKAGGNAVDAAVATAFALAVTLPAAGNIGGGGFLVYRGADGAAVAYDFRETAPTGSNPTMFLKDGVYDKTLHHDSAISVGVPGTVAGLYLAWQDHGSLPWKRLVEPAVKLARDGFVVSNDLARSLREDLPNMQRFPTTIAQFTKDGTPYEPGDLLRQPDLARTLERIAQHGPAGFYQGETARLIVAEMQRHGGLITLDDLAGYRAQRREPVRGTYRNYEIISMPPPSSGGTAIVEMLNILEGDNLAESGYGSARTIHLEAEAMRRAFADRAACLGDPDFNDSFPIARLTSKDYARSLRATIDPAHASHSSPTTFTWPRESNETTHVSVVDDARNAVSLTYTIEDWYGSRMVVTGGGFLLNNEMGDFNAAPGLTNEDGLIGTDPNLAAPGKRMLSSMAPTIVTHDGSVFMVTGSPGGRSIINTVLETIINVVDFGMDAQQAVSVGRFHHQWLPDRISYEPFALSPDTMSLLRAMGHTLYQSTSQGAAEVIILDAKTNQLEGGVDPRAPDGGAGVAGKP